MKNYTCFAEALDEYREDGGVMLYIPASSHGPDTWQLMSDVETRTWYPDIKPSDWKCLTEDALANGGLTNEQIEKELEGWVDVK